MKSQLTALTILLLISVAAYASGAPWYKWQNKVNKTVMCKQLSPGEAWYKFQGPYRESNCRTPGYPQ